MAHKCSFVLITLAGLLFATTANAQSLEGPFRGMLVCGQLKTATELAAIWGSVPLSPTANCI
ncbi:MAG: hypothetical protein WB760_00400 [Xanthobacteraceae bacterium]